MESKFSSRKLWFGVMTSTGIFLGGLCAAWVPGFRPIFETLVGGLLGSFGIMAGSNVGAKYLATKTTKRDPEARTRKGDKEDRKSKIEPQGE